MNFLIKVLFITFLIYNFADSVRIKRPKKRQQQLIDADANAKNSEKNTTETIVEPQEVIKSENVTREPDMFEMEKEIQRLMEIIKSVKTTKMNTTKEVPIKKNQVKMAEKVEKHSKAEIKKFSETKIIELGCKYGNFTDL